MRRIHSAALGLLVSLGAASIATAQSTTSTTTSTTAPATTTAAARPAGRGQRGLFKNIQLTAAQKTQVKAIRQKYHAQGKAGRTQEMAEVRALLSPEQQQRFDANLAAAKGKGHGKGRGGSGTL